MQVKICGITREEDALAAAALGAAAIGFVFWPGSPRYVDPRLAQRIVSGLPPFTAAVGIFVDEGASRVRRIAESVGLNAVQLHGDETPADCEVPGFRVIKAVPATGQALAALDRWPDAVTLLVDSVDPRRRGGTGRTADWSVAAEMAARRRVILAGGLTAENVAEAIRRVRPFAVDVSSGVEVQPGVKSREKMRALFAAIGRLGPEGGTTGSGEGR